MPREARNNLETSFFHIIVQGVGKEYIFNNENYIKKYLYLLFNKTKEYNVKILAYCIMNNHAHILIYTERIKDMSDAMHYINTLYAQYYNFMENKRVGHVFRDRYKSEAIRDERYLINCIKYIHNNPVKAGMVKNPKQYKYSTYNQYLNKRGVAKSNILNELIDINMVVDNKYDKVLENIFIDIDKHINDEEIIKAAILEFQKKNKISFEEIKKDKKILLNLVKSLKVDYKIAYKNTLNVIKISKSQFGRILQEEKMGTLGTVPKVPKGGKR